MRQRGNKLWNTKKIFRKQLPRRKKFTGVFSMFLPRYITLQHTNETMRTEILTDRGKT